MNENGMELLDQEAEEVSPIVAETIRQVKAKKADFRVEGQFAVLDNYFRLPLGTYKLLERNVKKGVNSLLIGPTGVGKSELASCIARSMDLPITILDMGTMVDPIMGLVGTHSIKIKGGVTHSVFIKSRFSQLIQQPGVICLDEISRAGAQSNNLLFPVLDFRKQLAMEYSFDDTEPVKVHPKCVFIATANLGSQYTGTHKLDRALVDRFMMIEIDPLDKEQSMRVIRTQYSGLTLAQATRIVDIYTSINSSYDAGTLGFNLSLRHLKMVAALVEDGFTIYDSYYNICKGIGSKEGLKSIESIIVTPKVDVTI